MSPSEDLNTNLIKSLTSVHLPPPPSGHHQHQEQRSPLAEYSTIPVIEPLRPKRTPVEAKKDHSIQINTVTPVQTKEAVSLQRDTHSIENTTEVALQSSKQMSGARSKRSSATSVDVVQPLTTPPHTVSRAESGGRLKKNKVQDTPTVTQGRPKRSAKDPLSPQYSSPSNFQPEKVVASARKVLKPPQPSFVQASKPLKRQVREQRSAQQQEQEQYPQQDQQLEEVELPSPSKMPKIICDSPQKPPYSYAVLIGMAILRGKNRKLTLSQIYHWISSTFKYYKMEDVGWQNSIRHNLSLNKAFIKTDKSIDGKGHYWEIVKGHEMQFYRNKHGKKVQTVIQPVPPPRQLKPAPLSASKSLSLDPPARSPSTSESDNSEDEHESSNTQTPKAQIRSTDTQFGYLDRTPLRKSNSAIGLQRFALPKVVVTDVDEVDVSINDSLIPRKKQQLKAVSTGNGQLTNIPQLEAPETSWAASALGERIIFGQVKPDSPEQLKPNLPLTSSFSCNTNYELSPLRRQETGPLLEPLTPGSRVASFATALNVQSSQSSVRTPLRNANSNSQNLPSGIMSANSHLLQFLRTPTAKTRTPNGNTNSILKKFWPSPSVMDDFYTSPSVPRNGEGSYHETLFGSPEKQPRRQLFQENSGTYDLFGVDICSVVQRAVDSCHENRLDSLVEKDGSSTDDDNDDDH